MSSPVQRVVYVEVYKHGESSPASYHRLRGAGPVETVKALLRAGLGPVGHYSVGQVGLRRVSAKIKGRRRECDTAGGFVDSYGGFVHSYYFRNADYEQAIESLSAVGFVKLDGI